MEIELLWPLVQELVQSTEISSEDWAFLRQNAETLGCSEEVLRAMVGARLAQQETEPLRRIQALSQLIEALGQESSRKLSFLLEVAQTLHLPVQLVQTMVQMPRTPALRYLVRLLQSVDGLSAPAALLPWLEEQTKNLKLPPQLVHYLLQLLDATQKKSLAYALQNYWEVLRLLDKHGLSAVEVAYLMDLAREARIADPVSQGLQEFLRLRARGSSPLEGLAHLIRSFVQKGILTDEELPFLYELAQQEGVSQAMVHALVETEHALRQRTPGGFGAEVLQPLIRTFLEHQSLDEPAMRLLTQRGGEVGLTRTHLEAIIELERQILEKKAKFPQSLQPLIRALVEDARISDDRLVYLIKRAQEMGGSDKVVRSLVQIEIAAQKKARQEKTFLVPPVEQLAAEKPASAFSIPTPYVPTPPPPPPPPLSSPEPSLPTTPEPTAPPPSPLKSPAPTASISTLATAFPKGGKFPSIGYDFTSMKAFSLRSDKDIIRRAECFSREGRTHWYAFIEYGERDYLLVVRGKPDHRFEEVLSWVVSPTGDVIALRHRMQGMQRVYLNGEEGRPLDEISSLTLSPDYKHLAYIGRKGEGIFVFLDNVGMGPFLQVSNLTFRPGERSDLFFVYQKEKNRWEITDHLQNTYGEPAPYIDLLTFSPNGKRMVYIITKNRKFHLKEGDRLSEPFDQISDVEFSEDSKHLVYLLRKGMQFGIAWDNEVLQMAEGIGGVVLSPDSRFVAYIARVKEHQYLCIHKQRFGPYDKVDKPLITRTKPAVVYAATLHGRTSIYVNGSPEAGPFEGVLRLTGRGESYAAIVRKGNEGQAVVRDGKIGSLYSTVEHLTWDEKGNQLAYTARRKGGWSGVVWNDQESDHYEFPQHLTFDDQGKALLFFARKRDGWYAVLNDTPIPDTLAKEIVAPPTYDPKSRSFVYLYRIAKDVYEGRITLK